jgi:hypothetical protein
MRIRSTFLAASFLLAAGCTTTTRVHTVSDSSWQAADGSSRSSYPASYGTPRTVQPRARSAPKALSKDDVLALTTHLDAQDAIAEIDRHPLGFPLDDRALGWFEDRLTAPEVVDYLRKRGQVNWDQLAETPAPQQPSQDQPWAQAQPAQPSYGYDSTPPAPVYDQPTTVYDQPPAVVYSSSYYDDYYYGRPYGYGYLGIGVYGGGPYYYGGVYRGGYYGNGYGVRGGATYRPNTYPSPYAGSIYRPGTAAGLNNPRGFQSSPSIQTRTTTVRTGGGATARGGTAHRSGGHR